jgi:glycine reductase complex component B subunit gamma
MVAIQLGVNRVVTGTKIPHPCGDPNLPPENDQELRREIVKCALDAIQTDLSGSKIFVPNVNFTSG